MKRLFILWVIVSLFLIGCSKNNEVTGNVVAADKSAKPDTIQATGTCKDSDDGINTKIKGIVDSDGKRYYDTCLTGILVEYYCDGDKLANQNIRCPNECSGGKCT